MTRRDTRPTWINFSRQLATIPNRRATCAARRRITKFGPRSPLGPGLKPAGRKQAAAALGAVFDQHTDANRVGQKYKENLKHLQQQDASTRRRQATLAEEYRKQDDRVKEEAALKRHNAALTGEQRRLAADARITKMRAAIARYQGKMLKGIEDLMKEEAAHDPTILKYFSVAADMAHTNHEAS